MFLPHQILCPYVKWRGSEYANRWTDGWIPITQDPDIIVIEGHSIGLYRLIGTMWYTFPDWT